MRQYFTPHFKRFLLVFSRFSIGIAHFDKEFVLLVNDTQIAISDIRFDFRRGVGNLFFHLRFHFIGKNYLFAFFGIGLSKSVEVSFFDRVFRFSLGGLQRTHRMICRTKEYTAVIFLSGKGYKIVQLFIVYSFSLPVKEVVPRLPDSGGYLLSNVAIHIVCFLVGHNQLVECSLRKACLLNQVGTLYQQCFPFITVGRSCLYGFYKIFVFARFCAAGATFFVVFVTIRL